MQYLKPRDAKDYYRAGRILVSKRLAYVLTALLLIFGIICLLGSWPVYFAWGGQGYPVFSEDSFPLKFYNRRLRNARTRINTGFSLLQNKTTPHWSVV